MNQKSGKLEKMIAELNDIVEQTYYFEQKLFEWKQKVEKNKARISKEMGRKDRLDVRVDEHTAFVATKHVKTNIEFYPDHLQQKLSKETFKKATIKQVEVTNLDGLIKFLKGYGVPPKEFKKFIKTAHVVDAEMIDDLIEIGEISIEDIQGCYKVDFEEEIKVRKTK